MTNEKQKTILILTGPMGSGHVRAALAVKEAFQTKYPDAHVIYEDTTVWMAPLCRWIFLTLYPFLIAHLPFVWRLIHSSHNSSGKGLFTFIFSVSNYKEKKYIKRLVMKKNVDLIVSTHFYPGYIVDEMKQSGHLSIPATLVITDHAGHRIYARKYHDLIFASDKSTIEQFAKYGIDPKKMRITGIPVFAKFGYKYSQEDLCRFAKELNLNPERYYVMLCMGGWATGDMCAAARSILLADKDFTLLVMTAHNVDLFRRLSLMAADDERIQPVSYTDQIEKYMALCSVIITKPGGITTSECIAMQKPMLLVDPIPGHEEMNLEYLMKQGLGITPKPGESLADAGKRLKTVLEELVSNMQTYAASVANASSVIAEESMALLSSQKD